MSLIACGDQGPLEPITGSLRVVVRTTGVDLDLNGYLLHFAERDSGYPVGVHEDLAMTLTARQYSLSLSDVAGNCTVNGDQVRQVLLERQGAVEVLFEVVCARAERIAFTLTSGPFSWRLAVSLADGSDVLPVPLGVWGREPTWSADGHLAYSTAECEISVFYYGQCAGGVQIYDGATGRTIAPSQGRLGFEPSWSRDGSRIAYAFVSDTSGRGTLRILRLADLAVTELMPSGVGSARQPSWSPDGDRLAFECRFSAAAEICLINADGTGLVRLTDDDYQDVAPAWSPDGATIAFSTNRFGAGFAIALVPSGGGDITRLTTGFDPAWSPDGSRLLFARPEAGLFSIGPDGSGLRQITTGRHSAPAWRP